MNTDDAYQAFGMTLMSGLHVKSCYYSKNKWKILLNNSQEIIPNKDLVDLKYFTFISFLLSSANCIYCVLVWIPFSKTVDMNLTLS